MTSPLFVGIPIYEIQIKNPDTGEMESLRTHEEIVSYLQTQEAVERFPGMRTAKQLADPRGIERAGLPGAPRLNILTAMSLIGLARQRIAGDFYASGAPVCLSLDADVFVHPETVGRMYYAIQHAGADVVLCAYPGRTPPHPWVMATLTTKGQSYDLAGAPRRTVEGHPSGPFRLIQILGAGFGCVMFSRRVYEKMAETFPKLAYLTGVPDDEQTLERPAEELMRMARMDAKFGEGPRIEFAFFTPEVRPLGGIPTFVGEDYAFFYRLQEAGMRCELLPDAEIIHDRYRSNLAKDMPEACQ